MGYKIVALNWRTAYCEIDIIARRRRRIYFVEVKSRRNVRFGSGLDYITAAKRRQMRRAAEAWVVSNSWGGDYQLAAAALDDGLLTFMPLMEDD